MTTAIARDIGHEDIVTVGAFGGYLASPFRHALPSQLHEATAVHFLLGGLRSGLPGLFDEFGGKGRRPHRMTVISIPRFGLILARICDERHTQLLSAISPAGGP
ncbi:hypothetical protein [Mesorhizobium sp. M1A.F.Ca.IN.020.04.1.1]|uniref:hypothetical protein n=1 Tax=Mesorhizobium sp. M1A.F.Ca.IN.020.04.1.1 TaxID=2496761 RepID=UPI001FE035C0|nr:hypothetical protein [Mesorhizobium sp. M1A.F.Ca.IN.020.04.1.1]